VLISATIRETEPDNLELPINKVGGESIELKNMIFKHNLKKSVTRSFDKHLATLKYTDLFSGELIRVNHYKIYMKLRVVRYSTKKNKPRKINTFWPLMCVKQKRFRLNETYPLNFRIMRYHSFDLGLANPKP